jgi:hypothetical protein
MQLPLFKDGVLYPPDLKTPRSGSFVDNMSLPIHRWFRYSAGFSAEWVERLLEEWEIHPDQIVLDPFVGSGTVPIACERVGISSVGIEAHPAIARVCQAKLYWSSPVEQFVDFAGRVSNTARQLRAQSANYPTLIQRSFNPELLDYLDCLKSAWLIHNEQSPAAELVWLAITAILRPCSKAGTAQWQYILPNKTKKKVIHPTIAFQQQVEMMTYDMRWLQLQAKQSRAKLISGDARECADLVNGNVDAVITSPPYANNYDYADAVRFEMTFWGEVDSWGDLHNKVRKYLIVSSSQHSSKEKLKAEELLASKAVEPIRSELTEVVNELATVREDHGGKKHYHTMVAAYCRDIAMVMRGLRAACRPGARMCWVIGDSAPYGIYCPIDRWIGELALAEGFKTYQFEKLRDRNIKWKNRKHRVPLKEGLLWIKG